jgi:hypothetical protein
MTVPKINKMDCAREAVSELGPEARAKDISAYILKTHGFEMSEKMASTYRATILRKGLHSPKKKSPATNRSATGAIMTSGGMDLEEIRAVKELADRLGAAKVLSLLDVLYS